MKRVFIIFTILMLLFLTGCSNVSGQSEEELRAEIKAELEAEAEAQTLYVINKEYKYDLDGDQNIDTFSLETDGSNYANLFINEWRYSAALEGLFPELLYKEYKLQKINGSNKYAIALYVASPPNDYKVYFYEYEDKGYDKSDSDKKEAEELKAIGVATIDLGLFNWDYNEFVNAEVNLSRTEAVIGGERFIIKAEAEAQKEEVQDEQDASGTEQENDDGQNDGTETLKTFDDLYDGTHLIPVIEYFDENYNAFSENAKNEFAQKIVESLREQVMAVFEDITMGLSLDDYVLQDSSIVVNLNGDQYLVDSLKGLENTELLSLAMSFWASDGDGVYENGFKLIVRQDIVNKLKKALEIVFPDEVLNGYYSLEPIIIPNVHYTSMDKPFDSFKAVEKGYATVQIESSEQLKLFDNENVWKTTLVLPINIKYVEGEETN